MLALRFFAAIQNKKALMRRITEYLQKWTIDTAK